MHPKTTSATAHIVQLSDCHLLADTQTALRGVNTDQSLVTVIDDLTRLRPPPDLILATGDLAQDGTREAYERFKTHLSELATAICVIPGNHDDPTTMEQAFTGWRDCGYMEAIHLNNWQIVPLCTAVSGSDGGTLKAEELNRLDALLSQARDYHVLIAMHHQPVPANMPALDAIALDNANDFFAIIDAHEQVRAVVWGHIHRQFEGWRGAVRLLGAPSTCFQFKPDGSRVTVDSVAPGYRLLRLAPDGTTETSVKFLSRLTRGTS